MEPQPNATPEPRGESSWGSTSQILRACLRALQLAAWLEAMVLGYRAVQPHGPGPWSWFLARCFLFSLGAYIAVGVLAQIVRRREAARKGATVQGGDASSAPSSTAPDIFDVRAFENAASALLFHFGTPLWLWIFA